MHNPIIEIIDLDATAANPTPITNPDTAGLPKHHTNWVICDDFAERVTHLQLPETAWQLLTHITNPTANSNADIDLDLSTYTHWTAILSCAGIIRHRDSMSYQAFQSSKKSNYLPVNTIADQQTPTSQMTNPIKPDLTAVEVPAACLKTLSDFLTTHKGMGSLARLTMYRIFSQVPRQLFIQEGITSFMFVGDTTEVKSPALRSALIEATEKVLGTTAREELEKLCSVH